MEHRVLDHGYVSLIEKWGSDEAIIEAARMSTGKGFLGWGELGTCSRCRGKKYYVAWGDSDRDGPSEDPNQPCPACHGEGTRIEKPGDEKLLRFLYENKHSTPFEMGGLTIEVQAPIFVFREWHRHRVPFGYSEMSARYTPMPDVSFLPDAGNAVERSVAASKKNKQAGLVDGAAVLTHEVALELLSEEAGLLRQVEDLYQRKLKAGFPKELARTHLTVSRYSRMRATGNLRGWLAFLTLRMAPGAQKEIRDYANVVGTLVEEAFPRTWALFAEKLP